MTLSHPAGILIAPPPRNDIPSTSPTENVPPSPAARRPKFDQPHAPLIQLPPLAHFLDALSIREHRDVPIRPICC